ncbi:hypothetical protein [Treponema sp.]|uniref:hypothetical protein n=1 Tax=Treponema sp. TaxID=166 RepID=UPI0038910C7F
MKRLFLNFLLVVHVILIMACSTQEKRLKKLWEFEKSIDYQEYTIADKEKIDKLLECFFQEEKYNIDYWDSGYSQQCYVLRRLYYEEILTKEDFLNRCANVYKRYEKNQTKASFHTMGFALCLYYLGQTDKAREMLIGVLENASEKDFVTKSDYEISIYICRKFLDIQNIIDSEDYYSGMTEEDIINIFCGN